MLSLCVNFWRRYVSFWTLNIGNVKFSALFSYLLWHIELKFFIWLSFNVLQIKFECCHSASVWLSFHPTIFCSCLLQMYINMHWNLSWKLKFDFGLLDVFLLEKYYIKKPFKMFVTGVLCTVCGVQVYFWHWTALWCIIPYFLYTCKILKRKEKRNSGPTNQKKIIYVTGNIHY